MRMHVKTPLCNFMHRVSKIIHFCIRSRSYVCHNSNLCISYVELNNYGPDLIEQSTFAQFDADVDALFTELSNSLCRHCPIILRVLEIQILNACIVNHADGFNFAGSNGAFTTNNRYVYNSIDTFAFPM